jgi:hypothetical protein
MPDLITQFNHIVSEDASTVTMIFQRQTGDELAITVPSEHLSFMITALSTAQQEVRGKRAAVEEQTSYRQLKNWAAAPHPDLDAVLLLLDRDTPFQANYAMDSKAAEDLGTALMSKSRVAKGRPKPNWS